MTGLVFLKLGGSLITDKTQPYMPRLNKLNELCLQVASVFPDGAAAEGWQLLLGHGSGSFGHTAAQEHGTRAGVHGAQGWRGFAEVHYQAAALNRHVMQALHDAGLPALSVPPSGSVIAREGAVALWETAPLRRALENGILPVIYGDVVFDEARGGTILSTEDLFQYLALQLHPDRILLAGLEAGVWQDFPARTRLIDHISPGSYAATQTGLRGAVGADVTGGMESKVSQMLDLIRLLPELEVVIFSAQEPGALERVLHGEPLGTKITAG
jgi:isopentenyl phosphate kinase